MSHYSKSTHSPHTDRDSIGTWGTLSSETSAPPPSHYSSTHSQSAALSHRSNPSYPSPSYGPSSPFTTFPPTVATFVPTPATPYLNHAVSLPQQYPGTPAPGAPLLSTIPLPDVGIIATTLNPLLRCPPRAVFNVTYPCSSIAFLDGLSSNDLAVYPPVQSILLGVSFICSGKTLAVRVSSPRGVTVHDVFTSLSSFLLSTPSQSDMSRIHPDRLVRGRRTQDNRRKLNGSDYPHLRWTDLLCECVYFGGLTKTVDTVYEVGFVSKPLA
ncbi:hypothetical protein C8R42DRAFT_729809 [Lentinula raphanica]|nr:hypothetical protein C8R42DRAFT_729809 [Lentinula raphanica]